MSKSPVNEEKTGVLFVGAVSPSARERDLEEIFDPYGEILRLVIKRGYAFVEFQNKMDAEDAMKRENGRELFDKKIAIEWARTSRFGFDGRRDRYRGERDRDRRDRENYRDRDRERDRDRDGYRDRERRRREYSPVNRSGKTHRRRRSSSFSSDSPSRSPSYSSDYERRKKRSRRH